MIPTAKELRDSSFENSKLGERVEEQIREAVENGMTYTKIGTASAPDENVERMKRYLEEKGYSIHKIGAAAHKIEWSS